MTGVKSAGYIGMRVLAFGIGLSFPFVSVLWKVIFLILSFLFRVIDIEKEKKMWGATPLFFFGMIIGFTYKLFST